MKERFTIQIILNIGIAIFDITPTKGVNCTEYYYDVYLQSNNPMKWLSCGFFRTLDDLPKIINDFQDKISA